MYSRPRSNTPQARRRRAKQPPVSPSGRSHISLQMERVYADFYRKRLFEHSSRFQGKSPLSQPPWVASTDYANDGQSTLEIVYPTISHPGQAYALLKSLVGLILWLTKLAVCIIVVPLTAAFILYCLWRGAVPILREEIPARAQDLYLRLAYNRVWDEIGLRRQQCGSFIRRYQGRFCLVLVAFGVARSALHVSPTFDFSNTRFVPMADLHYYGFEVPNWAILAAEGNCRAPHRCHHHGFGRNVLGSIPAQISGKVDIFPAMIEKQTTATTTVTQRNMHSSTRSIAQVSASTETRSNSLTIGMPSECIPTTIVTTLYDTVTTSEAPGTVVQLDKAAASAWNGEDGDMLFMDIGEQLSYCMKCRQRHCCKLPYL